MKKGEPKPAYYPVSLNIKGRKCVVVGGGEVALRKVKALLEHGARVTVISPNLSPELVQMAEHGEITALNREYRAGDLKDSLVAIAATDDGDTNRQVVREAKNKAVLVNVVDDAEDSDFIVPSCLRRGDVTIAVATAGRSPALARKIRTSLEEKFGEEYAALARLVDEVRTELKQQGITVGGDDWQAALDLDELTELLRKGEKEKARALIMSKLKAG
jgi:siroheme synthase-like protein